MAEPAILSVHDAMVTFGKTPLFEELSFHIHAQDRICLVGKNGAGKTTLMKLVTAERDLDGGERWVEPGTTIGYLQQDVRFDAKETVFEFISKARGKDQQGEEFDYVVDMVMEPFDLRRDALMGTLSGGQVRRAALARALIEEPDILLLDEPTNHLDITAIEWLETYLRSYRGALLCVSHDRTFLSNISNKVFWLDRGRIRVCPQGFAHFEDWSEMLLEQEERELQRRQSIVAQEVAWASKGVKARRKRNVRRVEEMKIAREKLKKDQSSFRHVMRKIDLEPLPPSSATKVVAEFIKVSHAYANHETPIVTLDHLNMRIMRGDRIGILGRNGSGKTSFLKLLIGEMQPDKGKVKQAPNLNIAYFDQNRRGLKDSDTLWDALCPQGGDYVDVAGKPRHVCGYLKDFLFDPKSARDRVGTLSGGQKNRLMLAKVLANPGDVLILDEPTNDLDMDTLDMLEEILSRYTGTLFVVSHDRDFLDQTVSQTLAFEGQGDIRMVVGGYQDYIREYHPERMLSPSKASPKSKEKSAPSDDTPPTQAAPKKLSYKLQYEYDHLPAAIATLEEKINACQNVMSDPDLYMSDPERFDKTSKQLEKLQKDLESSEIRWLELAEMVEAIKNP